MMAKTSVTARAEVTVDLHVGSWGDEATFANLKEQVAREAVQLLKQRLGDAHFSVVGEPIVRFITVVQEKR